MTVKNWELVWTEDQIQESVATVASRIERDYSDYINSSEILLPFPDINLVMIGILNGCVFFFADLLGYMGIPCEFDFAKISSWDNVTNHSDRRSFVNVLSLPKIDIKDKYVVLVDDILDTGGAMEVMQRWAFMKGAAVVKIATLLNKPANRTAKDQITGDLLKPDYVGFDDVESLFYFGYGMDLKGIRKSHHQICALIDPTKPEYYSNTEAEYENCSR